MDTKYLLIGIILMALVTYALRVSPLVLFRKKIENKTIQSFLHYVPYVTLAVMTFPAILQATEHAWAGLAALVAGLLLAWFGAGLFPVAVSCCVIVFVMEHFL